MNKKGMTLVEIIISIVLISIVLIFLFSLLITVKDINDESEVNSTYLINKSLILKNIEEDLDKAESVTLSSCDVYPDIYSSYGVSDDYFPRDEDENIISKYQANKCIGFKFGEDNIGYLGIYYYKSKKSYVISYIHDDIKATRLLPQYEENNKNIQVDTNNIITTWKYNNGDLPTSPTSLTNGNFHVINIPIVGPDGKDYSINISYYGTTTT